MELMFQVAAVIMTPLNQKNRFQPIMSFKTHHLMVWGHRGHRHHRYDGQHGLNQSPHENSLKAYQHVLKYTTGLECDVVQSGQKTPFLVHDTLFNGITQYQLKSQLDEPSQHLLNNRYIYQLMDDELEQLRLKDGQALPRLAHLLKLMPEYPQRYLNLELKGPSVADTAVRTVEHAIRQGHLHPQQIIFSSYNLPILQNLRLNVGMRFKISVMLTPADLQMAQMYPNWPNAEQNAYYMPFTQQSLQRSDIREINPDFLHVEAHSLTEGSLKAMHELYPDSGIILWCAGEKHPKENPFLIEKTLAFAHSHKLVAVISDFPVAVQTMLTEQGLTLHKPEDSYVL